jgi:hypothetical protein
MSQNGDKALNEYEKKLMDAIAKGEIEEYCCFEPAMDNLLAFRSGQSDLPDRKKRRQFGKFDPKHWKDQRYAKRRRSAE